MRNLLSVSSFALALVAGPTLGGGGDALAAEAGTAETAETSATAVQQPGGSLLPTRPADMRLPAGTDPCRNYLYSATIDPLSFELLLARGDAKFDGRPALDMFAQVVVRPRRLVLDMDAIITERSHAEATGAAPSAATTAPPPVGDGTLYIRHVRKGIDIPVPEGCVIDSISMSTGRIHDGGSSVDAFRTVFGDGVLDEAQCSAGEKEKPRTRRTRRTRETPKRGVECQGVRFRPIQVRFRGAGRTVCGVVTVTPPAMGTNASLVSRGDPALFGHSPLLRIDSVIAPRGGVVTHAATVEIEEDGSDHTTVTATVQQDLFNVATDAPGCQVVDVRPRHGRLRARGRTGDSKARVFGGVQSHVVEGHIRRAGCRTAFGEDKGKLGCGLIEFTPVEILLRPIGG